MYNVYSTNSGARCFLLIELLTTYVSLFSIESSKKKTRNLVIVALIIHLENFNNKKSLIITLLLSG